MYAAHTKLLNCSREVEIPRPLPALFYDKVREYVREVGNRLGIALVFRQCAENIIVEAGEYGVLLELRGNGEIGDPLRVCYSPYGAAVDISEFIDRETDFDVASIACNLSVLEAPLLDLKEGIA